MIASPSQDELLAIVEDFVEHNKRFKVEGIPQDILQKNSSVTNRERMRQIKNRLIKKKLIRLKMGRRTETWIPTK